VENALVGTALDEQAIAIASSHATDSVSINGDLYASDNYRKHLAQVYTRRAIEAAASRAK
jgi:carbon-monoxide dehydrogenase medium subunit